MACVGLAMRLDAFRIEGVPARQRRDLSSAIKSLARRLRAFDFRPCWFPRGVRRICRAKFTPGGNRSGQDVR
eukprot:11163309-Lingulodinium_polyedra.AAC.1